MGGAIIGVLVVGVIAAGFWWNWQQAAAAFAGVQFTLPYGSGVVAGAAASVFADAGARGLAKSMFHRVSVTRTSPRRYAYRTSLGDEGYFEIQEGPNGQTTVVAETVQLFRGRKARHAKSGFYQLVFALDGMLMKALGFRQNAGKMKGFQDKLQARLEKQIGKDLRSPTGRE